VADAVSDEQPKIEPVIEPMPEASNTPVSTVTPLVTPFGGEIKSYKGRFAAVYVGLALVLAAAGTLFLVVMLEGSTPAGPAWSTWKPTGSARLEQAASIAQHVAPQYRLGPGGAQLVAVKATPPEVQNISVEEVALKGASASQDYKFVTTKNAVVYVLCGLGTRCSIATGTPTQERARLLRREALELALYTFKYVDGVDAVIALIPPPANDKTTNWALFFEKKNFDNELKRPLSQTLPIPARGKKLVPASVVGNQDERTVERLTRPYWFTSVFQQLQDGNAVLVLDPVVVAR
jgi:hypothetical protein